MASPLCQHGRRSREPVKIFEVPTSVVEVFTEAAPEHWLRLAIKRLRGTGGLIESGVDVVAVWGEGEVGFQSTSLLPAQLDYEMGLALDACVPGEWLERRVILSVDGSAEGWFTVGTPVAVEDYLARDPFQDFLKDQETELRELGERVYGTGAKRRFWRR